MLKRVIGNPGNTRIAAALVGLVAVGVPLFLQGITISRTPVEMEKKDVINPLHERQEYKDIVELQNAFVRNAKLIRPSVVNLSKVKEVINRSSWYDDHSSGSRPWFRQFKDWLGDTFRNRKYLSESVGSGLILDSQGHILTNYHVIEDSQRILVRTPDKRELFARIVGLDSKTDLAVLKVSSFRSLSVPEFGSSSDLQVGEWVMAIGNPYGLEGTVTVGVVSAKGRSNLGITTFEDFIQTDASINPGNSGGPLINLDGKIVGINTAVAAVGSGVGFAIPIEMASKISRQIIETGGVERGWLGVGIQPLDTALRTSFKLRSENGGVLVNSLEEEAPAQNGGMKQGDVIVRFDGKEVSNSRIFQTMVANTRIGKVVPITVIRNGKKQVLHVKIGKKRS